MHLIIFLRKYNIWKQTGYSLKSHLEKSHKDLHSPYLSNVGDRNCVVNTAKKTKLEESPSKILDMFPANTAAFQERHAIFGYSGSQPRPGCKFSLSGYVSSTFS